MADLFNGGWLIIAEATAIIFLAMAAVTDIKDNTIAIWMFPSLIPIAFILRVGLFGPNWLMHAITGAAVVGGMLVPVLAGRIGGGDLIMLGSLALCFGPASIFVTFAGTLVGLAAVGIYKIIREKSFCDGIREAIAMNIPLAPYTAAGFALYLVVKYQFGGFLWAA